MENSIVFIIIKNNNPSSQIITSSQSKNGSDVVVQFILKLTNVSVIHVQKLYKSK